MITTEEIKEFTKDFDYSKLLLKNYCINEELEVYESDEIISRLNQELIFNNIKVFRIYESQNTLEKEFFKMVNNDKSNTKWNKESRNY